MRWRRNRALKIIKIRKEKITIIVGIIMETIMEQLNKGGRISRKIVRGRMLIRKAVGVHVA